MHVVSVKQLREFWQEHADSKAALQAWYKEAKAASWKSYQEIKQCHGSADCLPGNRVVFDIKGNRYRMVVRIHYNSGRVYVRFIGTHPEYDKINAETS